MTRTKQLLISIGATVAVALVLVPSASALRDYAVPNGAPDNQASAGRASDYSSPNAIIHRARGAVEPSSATAGHSSLNAILGGRSVNVSRFHQAEAGAQPSIGRVDGSESGGFDWSDALIGAGSAVGLVALVSGAVVLARRRRQLSIQPTSSS
jgi:hypothetical protein